MHRTKVRVVEGVLDANDTIAGANRADFDRAGVTVVNLMSAPGAGKTSLLERVRSATSTSTRSTCSSSRTSATSSARPSSGSARTRA
jgi:hypothetical protein